MIYKMFHLQNLTILRYSMAISWWWHGFQMVNHHIILWLTLIQTWLTMFQLCSQQLIPSQKNCWYYLIDAGIMKVQVKVKKSIKLTKTVENEEVKIPIFWETWWISTKLGKLELMMTSKVTKNKTLHSLHKVYFLQYILRVKV